MSNNRDAFVERAGQILAQALEDGTDQHDYIDRLFRLHERCIGPVPAVDWSADA